MFRRYCQLVRAWLRRAPTRCPALRGRHRHLLPDLEGPAPKDAIVLCSDFLATYTKQIPNDTVNGEEALSLAGGLEPPHLSFSMADRFMRYLGSVVRPTTSIVRYCWHDLTMSSAIATELVGHQTIRPLALSLEQLAKEAYGSTAIPPGLNQDVNRVAILIDGSPQVLLLTLDLEEHLVKIPKVAELALFALQPPGIFAAELPTPLANRLIGDDQAALGEQILDVAETQAEPVVEPDGMADNQGREAVASVTGVRLAHGPILTRSASS